ncbi:hypothetical protein C8J57DRAFT_187026 [Mycena rebaudengoi]|nr:hypothetical protein C8J57DRAFT_187026 [Mycena rebaudengoi]
MEQQLDSNTLIALFTAYYFLERCLRFLLKFYDKTFYDSLKASRKDMVFFGISMGLLISLASTPSCIRGALNAWGAVLPGTEEPPWFLDGDAQICVTARAVLWVSELNRLDLYPLYVVHHAGSIISLLSFLYFRWPTLLFLLIFSTLGSEVPGDLLWMVSAYIDSMESAPRGVVEFKRRLNIFNVAQYALFRGAGIGGVAWILMYSPAGLRTRTILMQGHAYILLSLYALFCAAYVFRQCRSLRARNLSRPTSPSHIPIELDGPTPRSAHIRIPSKPPVIIVPYGALMGAGFAALTFTSLTIATTSRGESILLSHALILTLGAAIFSARVFSIVMEDGFNTLIAVGAIIAWQMGYVPDFPLFASSLAVGLPLYETFSRVGCHTYGCCYGCSVISIPGIPSATRSRLLWRMFPLAAVTYDHPTDYAVTRAEPKLLGQPLIPIQLISAALFLLQFLCISLPLAVYCSPLLSGAVTLVLHSAIRLIIETCRADYRGTRTRWLSTTGKIAVTQAAMAMTAVAYLVWARIPHATVFAEWSTVLEDGRLPTCITAMAMGIVVYGVHVEEIGKWIPESDQLVPEKAH